MLTFDYIMKYSRNNKRNFEDLSDFVLRERIIPFVGAGLSAPIYPLWGAALKEVAEGTNSDICVGDVQKYIDALQYEEAATYLSEFMGEGEFFWKIDEIFDVEKIERGEINEALYLLPQLFPKTVVTTNYDRLLEKVYSAGGHTPGTCNLSNEEDWVAIDRAIGQEGRRDIIKLHGDCNNHHSRIFTKESYERVYGQPDIDAPPTPFVKKLADLFKYGKMLFLGCGLKQDRTIMVLKKIVGSGDKKHFAVMESPDSTDAFEKQSRHLSSLRIRPVWYPHGRHEAVAVILKELRQRAGKNQPLPSKQKAINNLEPHNSYFTGRDEYLEQIRLMFEKGDSISITQSIFGLGGVGKTQIALEYAHKHIHEYKYIWWVNADDENTILRSYIDFITKFGLLDEPSSHPPELCRRVVWDWLHDHADWLFIFDNADFFTRDGKQIEPQTMLKEYLPPTTQGAQHVLITSRNAKWPPRQRIKIGMFSPEESADFLANKTGQPVDDSMKELAEELGNLPLALEQVVAYMNCYSKSSRAYLDLFHKNKARLLKEHPGADNEKQIIYNTWDISRKRIEKKSARQLLNLCAFFAPDDFSIDWLIKAGNVLPMPLRKEIQDEISRDAMLEDLFRNSLITLKENHISMHRLLRSVIKDSLGGERQRWAEYSLKMANALVFGDFSTAESRMEFISLRPHISSIADESHKEEDEALKKKADLYAFLGMGEYELANYAQALTEQKKVLAIREKALGREHPDTATTYNNIAELYRAQGEYEKALTEHKKALAIREKALGLEHPDTATTYNNIAAVYHAQGEYEKALTVQKKALAIHENALGQEHPDTATTYNNIALVYYNQGEYKKALTEHKKALAIRENALGREHPSTATAYNNIASVYYALGEYEKALIECKKSLIILLARLGPAHPTTKKAIHNARFIYNEIYDPATFEQWLGNS